VFCKRLNGKHRAKKIYNRACSRQLIFTVLAILLRCGVADSAELFTNPSVPVEGNEVAVIFQEEAAKKLPTTSVINLCVNGPGKVVILQQQVTLRTVGDHVCGDLKFTPERNGMYHAVVSSDGIKPITLAIPVLDTKRQLDFAWYRPGPWLRWATVVTHAQTDNGEVKWLQQRGIKALRWKSGSTTQYKGHKDLPSEQVIARAKAHYTIWDDFVWDGMGIDEFGAYPATDEYAFSLNWLRGLVLARDNNPQDTCITVWHCGPINDEWLGLYRSAADILLIEAYEMYFVPSQLAAENIYQDLFARILKLRRYDMFNRAYGSTCKSLISLDIGGRKGAYDNPNELEQIVRYLRRAAPEMRGISFYNGSCAKESLERVAQDLCFQYFIKPVITFQEQNLWFDRYGNTPALVAAISNIGAMDSGPVTVRLRVNGQVLDTRQIASVPAGYSRLDNRAMLRFEWAPAVPGTYQFEVEVIDAVDSTILNPVLRHVRYISTQELAPPVSAR